MLMSIHCLYAAAVHFVCHIVQTSNADSDVGLAAVSGAQDIPGNVIHATIEPLAGVLGDSRDPAHAVQ